MFSKVRNFIYKKVSHCVRNDVICFFKSLNKLIYFIIDSQLTFFLKKIQQLITNNKLIA